MSNPVKDAIAKAANTVHRSLFDATKGKLGGTVMGMPALKLTTTGRKSGQRRTVMLTSPLKYGDDVVLVASYGGDDQHPAWYVNLLADPSVTIVMEGREFEATARTATAEEKDQIWPRVTEAYKGYAGYQKRTDREIPVVLCTPIS